MGVMQYETLLTDLPKLRVSLSVHFPCPARLDFAEPHVQIEEEAVSTEAVSTNGEQGGNGL